MNVRLKLQMYQKMRHEVMDSANEDRLKRQEKMQKSIWFSSVGNSGGVYQFR